jgi:hypothetical protein
MRMSSTKSPAYIQQSWSAALYAMVVVADPAVRVRMLPSESYVQLSHGDPPLASQSAMPEAARRIAIPDMDTGSPSPTILWGNRHYLLYYASGRAMSDEVIILEFQGGLAIRSGLPNDESLMNHRLWASGLTFYAGHEVEDSDWLREIESKEAHRSSPGWIRAHKHYVFTFHDETVPGLARDFSWHRRSGAIAGS